MFRYFVQQGLQLNFEQFNQSVKALREALEEISNNLVDNKIRAHPGGFQQSLGYFEFCFGLQFSMYLFEVTERLIIQLQSTSISAGQGIHMAEHAINEFDSLRSEDRFKHFWQKAFDTSREMDADPSRLSHQQRASTRFQQSEPHKFTTPLDMYS